VSHRLVLGCGRTGAMLAAALAGPEDTVAVVDREPDAFRRLAPGSATRLVHGNVLDAEVLERAGIREATAVAAVTSGDNSNIVAARIARETFGIPSVVARIKDPRRAEIYQRLGITTVATVAWTVDQVLRRLQPGEAVADWSHPSGGVHLVEHELPLWWAGRALGPLVGGSDRYRLVRVTAQAACASPAGT
jgi:trk system potassium uptake protein